jgi:hypothetical protein
MRTTCIRPHCAIRSHDHDKESEITFADFLEFGSIYRSVSHRCYNEKDKEYIDNYKLFSTVYIYYTESSRYKMCEVIKKMLLDFENEKCLEFRKLRILYVFAICNTIFVRYHRNRYSPLEKIIQKKFHELINATNDQYFIDEMFKIWRN